MDADLPAVEGDDIFPALPPMEDNRTDEQLKADGDYTWPDGSRYIPPGRLKASPTQTTPTPVQA